MFEQHPLRLYFATADRRTLALAIGIGLAIVSALIGLSLALIGPIYTIVLLLGLAGAFLMIANLEYSIWAVITIVALLPFATLPVKIVLTPTFLDMALGAVLFLYISQWMFRERQRLTTTPVHMFIILFMILSIFSFVAGLRYGGLAMNVLRKFAEFLLSMGFALLLVDIIRTPEQLRKIILVVILSGAAAAVVGIMLWVMPDELAERALVRLSIIGYPDGGVIQYIEQNPELSERAISTSVNPNSLGGLLVMIGALAAPQLMTRYPITGKQWHTIPLLGAIVVCLILTFSRGSMVAFAAAIVFIAALRYRRVLGILIVIGLVLLILPWSQPYIERFISGFQGEDLAMKMRFGEYTDALTLISRYPLFGAGFSGAPDIDIYLGVSSVYLLMGEHMGLLGVAAFFLLMISIFVYAWQARPYLDLIPGLSPIWLGLLAALVGALLNGIVDHYFFNIEFQHAILIFWIFVGLTLATSRIALAEGKSHNKKSHQPKVAIPL